MLNVRKNESRSEVIVAETSTKQGNMKGSFWASCTKKSRFSRRIIYIYVNMPVSLRELSTRDESKADIDAYLLKRWR